MGKNVLVISTSLRPGSNSEILATEFARGASEAGHAVEQVSLRGMDIKFCVGCLSCQKRADGHCFMKDEVDELVQKMRAADALCFATPIYYYEMSAPMKAVLDRANPLYCVDYAFRDVYFLGTAAEDEDSVFDRAINGLGGWIECFEHARLAGEVRAGGLDDPRSATGDTDALAAAYELGRHA